MRIIQPEILETEPMKPMAERGAYEPFWAVRVQSGGCRFFLEFPGNIPFWDNHRLKYAFPIAKTDFEKITKG